MCAAVLPRSLHPHGRTQDDASALACARCCGDPPQKLLLQLKWLMSMQMLLLLLWLL